MAIDKYATLNMMQRERLSELSPVTGDCIARPGDVVIFSHDGPPREWMKWMQEAWQTKAPDVQLVIVDRRMCPTIERPEGAAP